MSIHRYLQNLRKMQPGTIGGQSLIATPVAPSTLQQPRVIPLPGCTPTGWLQTALVDDVGATTFSAAFDPDSDYVWTADNGSTDADVRKRHFATMEPVGNDPEDWLDGVNPGGAYTMSDLSVDQFGRVWTIGYDANTSRATLWRWRFDGPTWSGTLMWQGELLSGTQPSVVYCSFDDRMYLRATYDSTGPGGTTTVIAVDEESPGWFAPGGGGEVIWSLVTSSLFTANDIHVTSDHRVVWPLLGDTAVVTIYSYNVATTAMTTLDDSEAIQWMAHAPNIGERFVVLRDPGASAHYYEFSSDLTEVEQVFYDELTTLPMVTPRGAAISHDGLRSVFQAAQATVDGGWWYRAEYCP